MDTSPETELDLGTPFLRLLRDGHLLRLTICRPESRNALSGSMYFGIKRAVQIANGSDDPVAMIVTGTDDVFAPGGELRGKNEDPNPVLEWIDPEARRLGYAIPENVPMPVSDYHSEMAVVDLGDGRSRLDWTCKAEPDGVGADQAKTAVEGMYGVLVSWVKAHAEG